MATQVAVNTKVEESIAFARGRQYLDRSVWYNGSLMTFLATAEDTQGRFALIEVGRQKRQCSASAHSSPGRRNLLCARRRDDRFGWRSHNQSHARDNGVSCRAASVHSFAIESEQLRVLILAHSRRTGRMVQGIQRPGARHDVAATGGNSVQRDTKNVGRRPKLRNRICSAEAIKMTVATCPGFALGQAQPMGKKSRSMQNVLSCANVCLPPSHQQTAERMSQVVNSESLNHESR